MSFALKFETSEVISAEQFDLSAIINSSKSSEKAEYYVKRSLIFVSNEEFAKAISDLNLAIYKQRAALFVWSSFSCVFLIERLCKFNGRHR